MGERVSRRWEAGLRAAIATRTRPWLRNQALAQRVSTEQTAPPVTGQAAAALHMGGRSLGHTAPLLLSTQSAAPGTNSSESCVRANSAQLQR